jgi:hypothetical protein
MKKKVVIKSSSLPARSPVGFAMLWWLLLEHIAAPGWAYGVLWTVVTLASFAWVYCFCATTALDVPGFGEK